VPIVVEEKMVRGWLLLLVAWSVCLCVERWGMRGLGADIFGVSGMYQ
jgi:hypothetical protein